MLQSIWNEGREAVVHPALTGELRADAVIIGGGITGLLTAWQLQTQGLRPVVLEANAIGSGQTGGTTAKLTIQHGLFWAELAQQLGRAAAQRYALAQQAAVDAYTPLLHTLGLESALQALPSVLYTTSQPAALREEAAILASFGLPARYLTDCELPAAGAVQLERQAVLEPLAILDALAQRLEVYEYSRVRRVTREGVFTAGGAVRTGTVIFACHYPPRDLAGWYFIRMHQCRSEALLLEAPAPSAMYIAAEASAPHLRPCRGHALLSGGSRRTGTPPTPALRQAAARSYPGARVLARWAAQDCMTPDGLPYIGRYAATKPHWYIATGYNGWGMSTAMLAAQCISAQITGGAQSAATQVADLVTPQRMPSPGALLQEGAAALTHELSPGGPRCPHMGCRLKRNPADGSWECPCHGSRFDAAGHLLDGPAQHDARNCCGKR